MPNVDAYISFDIEADGPIPGPYSMLSVGMALAGTYDGNEFLAADPEQATFYRELRPISDCYDPEALAVSGLDRERLLSEGAPPEVAMQELDRWVRNVCRGRGRPVAIAWPLSYDWTWLYWYLIRFHGTSPFGFSRALDVKTMFAAAAHAPVVMAAKEFMPPELQPSRPHTHHALDDALGLAEMFQKLMTWTKRPPAPPDQSRSS